jgi:hypothetical protein
MSIESIVSNLPVPAKKAGRPVGSRNKKTVFVEGLFHKNPNDVKAIVRKCIEMSKAGDPDFARMTLAILCPPRKGALLRFALPSIQTMADVLAAYDGLLQAVSQGHISSAEAVELSTVLDRLRQGLESKDLDERIAKLESAEAKRLE